MSAVTLCTPLTASDAFSPMLLPAFPEAGSFFRYSIELANVEAQSKPGVQCRRSRSRLVSLKASIAGAEAPIPQSRALGGPQLRGYQSPFAGL